MSASSPLRKRNSSESVQSESPSRSRGGSRIGVSGSPPGSEISPGGTPRGPSAPSSPIPTPEAAVYRVVLLGDANAGKSCYHRRLDRGDFHDDKKDDTGLSRARLRRTLPNGSQAIVDLWDSQAAELLPAMRQETDFWRTYLGSNPHGLVVIYSDKSLDELDRVEERWLKPLRERPLTKNLPLLLVLNLKYHLMVNHHASMLNTLAERYCCLRARINIKTNEGVRDSLFDLLCTMHYRERLPQLQLVSLRPATPPLPVTPPPVPDSAASSSRGLIKFSQMSAEFEQAEKELKLPEKKSSRCCRCCFWC